MRFFGFVPATLLRFVGVFRVNKSLCIWVLVAATGCGASKTADVPINDATDAAATEIEELKAHSTDQDRELRMVKSQLALAQAEARDLREQATDYHKETVRIGTAAPESFTPPPRREKDYGPRPVLRLYGSGGAVPIEQLEVTSGSVPELPTDFTNEANDSPTELFLSNESAEGLYRNGLRLVRDQKFEQALRVFTEFVKRHADHPYADNALFWQGEIRYLRREYAQAVQAFEQVSKAHPNGNKVPDALYKIGLIRLKQGDTEGARRYFDEVRKRFPSTAAAQLASREDPS